MILVQNTDRQYFTITKIKKRLEKLKKELEKESLYKDSMVPEITPFKNFYAAENHHKDYYKKNRNAPYCNFVIDPKVHKLLQN